MRIATWNLDRPKRSKRRRENLVKFMATIEADVWVLTETQHDLSPGNDFWRAAQSETAMDLEADEHWTAIWVRNVIEATQLRTRDAKRTACLKIATSKGLPLLVYGTVLPWLGEPHVSLHSSEVYGAALAEQEKDWLEFRRLAPFARLCVVGDLNQDLLSGRHFYGSRARQKFLREALERSGMTCLTGDQNDPVARRESGEASIDHICIAGTVPENPNLRIWPEFGELGSGLTDHYGVAADLWR